MNKEKRLSLRLTLLAGFTSVALLATSAGSLAWYAYSRTVSFTYKGTSVASSNLLNVGLVDDGHVFTDEECDEYNLKREDVQEGDRTVSICFAQTRAGFSVEALQKYLERTGRAVTKLYPVTTQARSYNSTDPLKLYRSPEVSEVQFAEEARDDAYVVLPFAFKIIGDDSSYVANKKVWLTGAEVDTEGGIETSVRVYVDGASKFLMKPADKTNTIGSTKVGGVLDLDGDGYYDFSSSDRKEFCYGDFESSPSFNPSPYPSSSAYDVLVDANGVGDDTTGTTFVAKHRPGTYVPDVQAANPLLQEHYGFGMIKPSEDSGGNYYSADEHPIAITANESKIGYATFTIFVEGWDYSIIDQKAGYEFSLALNFEINRAA